MSDDFTPDDALDAVAHLARSLDRVASSAERTEAVVTDLARTLRPLRWTLPLAWVVLGIGLCTLAFVAWSTVTLVREGRVHHERMLEGHQARP